jgi:hypothetical protein
MTWVVVSFLVWVGVSFGVPLLMAWVDRGRRQRAERREAPMREVPDGVMRNWSARESGNE